MQPACNSRQNHWSLITPGPRDIVKGHNCWGKPYHLRIWTIQLPLPARLLCQGRRCNRIQTCLRMKDDQPSFVGLFRPQLFKSLLHKTKTTTWLGSIHTTPYPATGATDPADSLFAETAIEAEEVPHSQTVSGRCAETVELSQVRTKSQQPGQALNEAWYPRTFP